MSERGGTGDKHSTSRYFTILDSWTGDNQPLFLFVILSTSLSGLAFSCIEIVELDHSQTRVEGFGLDLLFVIT